MAYDWYNKFSGYSLQNSPQYSANKYALDWSPTSMMQARRDADIEQGIRNKAYSDQINSMAGIANQAASTGALGNVGGGILSGAASGASVGSSIMPGWGTLIGGVVGGIAGGIGGGVKNKKERETKEDAEQKYQEQMTELKKQNARANERADRELGQQGIAMLANRRDASMKNWRDYGYVRDMLRAGGY